MKKSDIENLIKEMFGLWLLEKQKEDLSKIRYAGPLFDKNDFDCFFDALFSSWWSGGSFTLKAEEKISKQNERLYSILTNSGSSANLLLMSAAKELYFKDGDKILTLACGFPTTVNPIIQNRLIPVFVDIDIETLNINIEVLERALKNNSSIKGIFIANTLGFPNDILSILDLCRKYNVQLFFDNCDSYASRYNGHPVAKYGKATSYSFYVAHHITCGEGGGLSTNDIDFHTIARGLRNWGRYCSSPNCCMRSLNQNHFCSETKLTKDSNLPSDYNVGYQFEWLGYNLKPLELQAALLLSQLDKLDCFTKKRQYNYNLLYNYFSKHKVGFKTWKIDENISPFSFPFLIPASINFKRKHLMDYCKQNSIECRVLFGGNLTKHPAFQHKKSYWETDNNLQNSDNILENFLMLGVSPILEEKHILKIIDTIDTFLKEY